jgi:tetratricopeptide (TPR) repeat protein
VLHLASGFDAADDPVRNARITRAADRANELDPDSPQASLAAALASERLTDALDHLKRAVALDPSYSEGYHEIGDEIADFDPARALAFYRRALALDPLMSVNHADIVGVLLALGRPDDATREIDSAPPGRDSEWKAASRLTLELDQHQYERALSMFDKNLLPKSEPMFALDYANTLRMAGRGDEAYQEAAKLVERSPAFCGGRATFAALKFERGLTAEARRLVAPAVTSVASDESGSATLQCGARSLAAVGDTRGTAALLRRIASHPRLLRAWALDVRGTTGDMMLREALFPLSRVTEDPAVTAARGDLDRAYTTAREQIATVLDSITPR